ncbi:MULTISPECIES: hypothetical protein [unclassified Streptomyces]|uniref:hypothetical protein n=1 Tax=unclassified Streptomyces TaxID=2593676 RepID=UPI0036F066FA
MTTTASHAPSGPRADNSPTLDEALARAARCLDKAEEALPDTAAALNETAHHWLDMANILLARSMPIR